MIRKIQYAPMKPGRQPCTMVKKDFMFSPGDLGKYIVEPKLPTVYKICSSF